MGKANQETIKEFYVRHEFHEEIDTDIWQTFKPDATMVQLEKIFNGWYLGNPVELDGIIQLFNCNYYKNPDLSELNDKYDIVRTEEFNEDQFLLDRPVYFGWGSAGKKGRIRAIAHKIFSNYDLSLSPIYNLEFDENCFYHPRYINMSYRKSKTRELLLSFNKLFKRV